MYPLKFNNIYFNKIWGSDYLKRFRNNIAQCDVGESWDLACHKSGMSIVVNGEYSGRTLISLIKQFGSNILGEDIWKEGFVENDFPIMIKVISSGEDLSIQVHPSDEYALNHENENGKIECWYILHSEEGAEIVLGTIPCDKYEFIEACKSGYVDKYTKRIKVCPGDVFVVKPGLIHSIGKGIVLAEFQQNSDLTYRVFDFNRGRELHIDKAIEVINTELIGRKSSEEIINLNKFLLTFCDIEGSKVLRGNKQHFYTLTCVEGEGSIFYGNGKKTETMNISTLDTIFIPAFLDEYIIKGNMKLIKMTPNECKY